MMRQRPSFDEDGSDLLIHGLHDTEHIQARRKYWCRVVLCFACGIIVALTDVESSATRCAGVVVIVCTLWMSEALPIAVTALLPIFLMPLFGVVSARVIAKSCK